MSPRTNGETEGEARSMDSFNIMESALNWQQQMLKTGLVSTEMMKIGMNHLRRQTEYLNMFRESLDALNKANAEFVQKVTTEAASDWSRTAEIAAATWSREVPQAHQARAGRH